MMFLTETNLFNVVKKQYLYKLKANLNLFISMIALQLIALLISMGSNGGAGGGNTSSLSYSVKYFSADLILIFTIAWAYIAAIILTTKANRDADFTFVSNRLSSNLANITILVTSGIIGGVTAILGGFLLRVIVYFYNGSPNISAEYFFVAPQDLLIGILVASLYIFLVSALGYLFGMLIHLSKALLIILPTFFAGLLIFEARIQGRPYAFIKTILFFVDENSFWLFVIKVLVAVIIVFGCAILISNRMEVRD